MTVLFGDGGHLSSRTAFGTENLLAASGAAQQPQQLPGAAGDRQAPRQLRHQLQVLASPPGETGPGNRLGGRRGGRGGRKKRGCRKYIYIYKKGGGEGGRLGFEKKRRRKRAQTAISRKPLCGLDLSLNSLVLVEGRMGNHPGSTWFRLVGIWI